MYSSFRVTIMLLIFDYFYFILGSHILFVAAAVVKYILSIEL